MCVGFRLRCRKWGRERAAAIKAVKMKLQRGAVKELNFILFSHIRFCL